MYIGIYMHNIWHCRPRRPNILCFRAKTLVLVDLYTILRFQPKKGILVLIVGGYIPNCFKVRDQKGTQKQAFHIIQL